MIRRGVRLGVDVGEVRVGLAASDPDGILATPVATVSREPNAPTQEGATTPEDVRLIVDQARDRNVLEVVVGLPTSMNGTEGLAAARARRYAAWLHRNLDGITVRLWDERLTTVDAHRRLTASGVPGRRQRQSVDQAAAVLILQAALDAERSTGTPGGEVVGGRKPRKPRTKNSTKEGNREPTSR
ncbi:MAG: Holliday junction resolvase RuvX [Ornithinimicrobium sp.]